MKKKIIYYGYNKKDYLESGIEGITPYRGEYIDIITINKRNYLFTKGISDVKKDIIDVREVIQNVYLDGSYEMFANAYRSPECVAIEKYFNKNDIKNKVESGISLCLLFDEINLKSSRANIIPINRDNQFTMITLVNNLVFEDARELLIKNSSKSFVQLALENKKKIR